MDDNYQTRRIVFVDHPALHEIVTYGRQHEWKLLEETPAGATKNSPRELVFKAGKASLEVHYCEDEATSNSYAFAVGATKNVAEALISMIEQAHNCWSLPQLLDAVDRGSGFDEKGQPLIRLTLSAPHAFDQDVYDRVRACLQDSDERLRSLAVWATSYTPWPEYQQLLRDVAAHDRGERVRERAARMLESFDAAGVEEK